VTFYHKSLCKKARSFSIFVKFCKMLISKTEFREELQSWNYLSAPIGPSILSPNAIILWCSFT